MENHHNTTYPRGAGSRSSPRAGRSGKEVWLWLWKRSSRTRVQHRVDKKDVVENERINIEARACDLSRRHERGAMGENPVAPSEDRKIVRHMRTYYDTISSSASARSRANYLCRHVFSESHVLRSSILFRDRGRGALDVISRKQTPYHVLQRLPPPRMFPKLVKGQKPRQNFVFDEDISSRNRTIDDLHGKHRVPTMSWLYSSRCRPPVMSSSRM